MEEGVPFSLDDLYFGTISVRLKAVPGSVEMCRYEETECESPQAEGNIRTPQIPGKSLRCIFEPPSPVPVPVPLRQCLLKTREEEFALLGIASGVRSAVVKVGEEWYRLKGCGNHADGFILQNKKGPKNQAWQEIRGSSYLQTARRELYVTNALGEGANGPPFAVYRYQQTPVPGIECVCAVEKTCGDRRLGTHALTGLDVLLEHLIDPSVTESDAMKLFPRARPGVGAGWSEQMATTADFMNDLMMGCLEWDLPRDETTMADARFKIAGSCERLPPRDDRWKHLWLQCRTELKDFDLGWLYARLGQESGLALRKLHNAGFVWGTYQDWQCRIELDEWHCNAHANNLVVRSQEQGDLLALLDLDMSFRHEGDASIIKREQVNMMEVLAGADGSTGAPREKVQEMNQQENRIKAARWALRDTLILAHRAAYDRGELWAPDDDGHLLQQARLLIRLALIETAELLA